MKGLIDSIDTVATRFIPQIPVTTKILQIATKVSIMS